LDGKKFCTNNYLGTTQGSFIGYGTVTEKEGTLDKGKKTSYFTTAYNNPNRHGTVNMVSDINQVTTSNNSDYYNNYLNDYDAYRGYLVQEKYFNGSNHLIRQTDIKYNLTEALNPNSTNYFELNSKAGLLVNTCIKNCGSCNAGGIDNCLPYSIFSYYIFDNKIISPWIYKQQTSDKLYDIDGLNPIETLTNYYYDNPNHGLVTTEELITSKGTVFKKNNKYAQDKGLISGLSADASAAIDLMIQKNMVSDVIETEEFHNEIFNSRIRTNYSVWDSEGVIVAPENTQSQIGLDNALENRIQFIHYDNYGNLLEASQSYGSTTLYLWGYKSQYPIAEIKNANYSIIEGILGGASGISDISSAMPTDAQVKVWADLLRTSSLLKDAHITSYTYKPLVGMTSMTDPKGMITYYEYDDFNRLKWVKDQSGNILKESTYHFKN
jgi:hypothetical protein